jgi:hypothetical protein
MIILTPEQAEAVAAMEFVEAALIPVPLLDQTGFILPADCLTDTTYEAAWPLLSTLPRRDVAEAEYIAADAE